MHIHRLLALLLIVSSVFFASYFFKRRESASHAHTFSLESLSDTKNIVPVAVIGSGPAGLSAALYAARMNMHTVVFKGSMPGGQLTQTTYVENWPGVGTMLGPDIMKKLQIQAENFGVQAATEAIERVDFSSWPYTLFTDDGTEIKALSVVIATGSKPKRLNIPGEEKFWGKGVTTCAVCDAPFYKDKAVAVVGGGDSAVEQAMELAAVAKSVTMLVRAKELRASPIMKSRIAGYPNISVRYSTNVKEVLGENQVKGLKLSDDSILPVDGLFLAIGHDPNTQIFKGSLETDQTGYLVLKHPTQATSLHGVFAAGDVADYRYRQAGVASGDGIKAALDAASFMRDIGFNENISRRLESRYYDAEKDIEIPEMTEVLTSKDFDELAKAEKRTLVLDFYAPYCPSCMQMLPIVGAVSAKLDKGFKFIKIDTGKSDELAKRFDVPMIPTILVIHKGKLVSRTTEIMNKRQLIQFLQKSAS